MPKVTVIIPVYKVEQYIARCACAIFEQTLDDIEIIFIDDCTPDNSVAIIEQMLLRYPNRKSQTIIFHQGINKGLPAARTKGIELASGEYIIHCDSDDWPDTDLYEKMYNKAVLENADIVLCDEIREFSRCSQYAKHYDYPSSTHEIIKNIRKVCIGMFVHNKLVKRNIYTRYNILPYSDVNMWEDMGLMFRLFYHAKSFTQINDSFYHYNRTNVSSMTYANYDGAEDMMTCVDRLAEFFKSKPDGDLFHDAILTLQYIAKLELISSRYQSVRKFNSLYPESNCNAKDIDINWFSPYGKIRFWFVSHKLSYLFVTLFKLYLFMRNVYIKMKS